MSGVLDMFLQSTQSTVFFTIFAAGFVFVALLFIIGEVFEGLGEIFESAAHFLHIADAMHLDTPDGSSGGVSALRLLAVFATAFGGIGWISTVSGYGPMASTLFGTAGGTVLAMIVGAVMKLILSQQTTSVVQDSSLVGLTCMLAVGIPDGGIGEIKLDWGGIPITKMARSKDGKSIPTNSPVKILMVNGSETLVERL